MKKFIVLFLDRKSVVQGKSVDLGGRRIIKKNDLNLEKINTYSDDYAKTLATWRKNFLGVWEKISPLGFDEYFKRMWEFYLSYCEGGFKSRNINLIQFSMSNRYSS